MLIVVVRSAPSQLLCLGMLGEYIGRMYTQMQGRPTYFIAYDSLTATKGRHGPTDTPLPPDARPSRAPRRRSPAPRTAGARTSSLPTEPAADGPARRAGAACPADASQPASAGVPASAARVRRDEEAHAGELLDR